MKDFFKTILGLLVFLGTFLVVVVAGSFWWGSQQFVATGAHTSPVTVIVEKGSNIGGIADQLAYAGIIADTPHRILFQAAGRITGQSSKLKAGEYEIPAHASLKDILDLLESGKTVLRQVTIPEGLTNWEIKQLLLAHEGLGKKEDFLMQTEGMYLPETYSYQKGNTTADVMSQMHEAMKAVLDEQWNGRAENLPLETKEQALALASIVEKETGVPEERARVAGVFINRLRQGMPLQTDPTVIYGLTMGMHKNEGQGPLGRRLLKKDLETDTPYNTYLHAGLPPTPIANPGRAAIEATLHPEAHEFIYFVADGTGGHVFAKTLDEHNANVAKWRQIRKSQ